MSLRRQSGPLCLGILVNSFQVDCFYVKLSTRQYIGKEKLFFLDDKKNCIGYSYACSK